MKDSYSFDADASGLDEAFDRHHEAYSRIFARLGIPAIPVQASSGSMGGSASVEFMCPSPAGEDLVVRCLECGYAANIEKARSALPPHDDGEGPAVPERFDTPTARTIYELARQHGVPADRQIKTLVYVIDDQVTLVLVRGDHNLVEQKLLDATGALAVRPAHPGEIRDALGASPGSLGAVGITDLPVIADEALRGSRAMSTGANIDGVHLRGVDVDRDISVGKWADLREIVAGEPCPTCGEPLDVVHAIEIGHIFKLGRKYTEALDVSVLGADGGRVTPIMGSYGIGVERAIAAIVEANNDASGIIWPTAVAPFEAAIVLLNLDDELTQQVAEDLYAQLLKDRIDVILDDRDQRPGAKFKDVELIGIPFRVIVGKRGLATGTVEITKRAGGETTAVAFADAAEHVRKLVTAARAESAI